MEYKIDNISQNATCPHENDLETVKSAEVNQGVLMLLETPFIWGLEDREGIEEKGRHLLANAQGLRC